MNRTRAGVIVLVAILLLAPLMVYPVFLMKVLCLALFASAFNLLFGYVGLMSFGHAAFWGAAGYVAGYATKSMGFTPELGILAGTAVAALLGWGMGALAIRRVGMYFSLVTLALAQMVYFLCVQVPFTGADDGLQGVPRGRLLGILDLNDSIAMYFAVVGVFLLGLGIVYRTIHSPFGAILQAIRENEPRAISLGYDVDRYKLLAFVISAAIAGLAGATKTIVFQFATLTDVHWSTSGDAVLMTLIGGVGTVMGPVVGALVVASLEHYLTALGSWITVVMGVIFVLCVLVFRAGVVGTLHDLRVRFTRAPAPREADPRGDEHPLPTASA
jgi:branched-chain amino acid transport system permease protein